MNERVETIPEHMTEDAKDIIAFALKAGSFESLTTSVPELLEFLQNKLAVNK